MRASTRCRPHGRCTSGTQARASVDRLKSEQATDDESAFGSRPRACLRRKRRCSKSYLHESRYRPLARGDHGRSAGAYQTPSSRTPATIIGQTQLAARILADAARACPAHPLYAYASGRCATSYAARAMERAVAASLAAAELLERVVAEVDGLRLEP